MNVLGSQYIYTLCLHNNIIYGLFRAVISKKAMYIPELKSTIFKKDNHGNLQ